MWFGWRPTALGAPGGAATVTGRVVREFMTGRPSPLPPSRARLNHDRILDVVAEIADADGLNAMNVRRLAARLQIKPASLYRHFSNMEVVKAALAARALTELIDLNKDATPGRAGRDGLAALAHAQRTYAQARPGRYLAAVQGGQTTVPAVAALRQTYLRSVAVILESYHIDGDEALEVARCVMAALQGFIILELSDGVGTPFETDQCYQRLLDMLDAGARAAARSHANRKPRKTALRMLGPAQPHYGPRA